MFLFGALCYTICTMKAPPQALEGPGEEPSWPVYHSMAFTEASSPGPSRAWRGGFMVFLFGAVLYNMHHEGSSSGPEEEPSWHLFLVSVMFDKA